MTNTPEALREVVALLEKATPGEWWPEPVRSDAGFDSYQVRADENKPLLDTLNSEVACVYTEQHEDGAEVFDAVGYADTKALTAAVNFLRQHAPEIERAMRDAERYRYLREHGREIVFEDEAGSPVWPADNTGDALDAAIDAAIASGNGDGEG